MDPVSSLNTIALALRKQLMEKGAARPGASGPSRKAADVATQKPSLDVEVRVALETLQIAPAESEAQALRRVINLILRQHFGAELENDAGFQNMVDSVASTISGDPELIATIKER